MRGHDNLARSFLLEDHSNDVVVDVKGALAFWTDSINAGRLDDVCESFTRDAIVLATFAEHELHTPEERRAYFGGLIANGTTVRVLDIPPPKFRLIGDHAVKVVGRADWRQGNLVMNGRFNFLLERRGYEWKISDLHSSIIPTKRVRTV